MSNLHIAAVTFSTTQWYSPSRSRYAAQTHIAHIDIHTDWNDVNFSFQRGGMAENERDGEKMKMMVRTITMMFFVTVDNTYADVQDHIIYWMTRKIRNAVTYKKGWRQSLKCFRTQGNAVRSPSTEKRSTRSPTSDFYGHRRTVKEKLSGITDCI